MWKYLYMVVSILMLFLLHGTVTNDVVGVQIEITTNGIIENETVPIETERDVDVQDFILNTTDSTFNGTDGNGTLINGTLSTTRRPVSAECLWFQNNPFWRLTATKTQMGKYLCACFNLCYSPEDIEALRNVSMTNRTEQSVFERENTFIFMFTFILYILVILIGSIANVLVIVGILVVMNDKSVVNRFVVSLAVADFFMSIFITPIKLLYHVQVMNQVSITWVCKIILYVRQMCQSEAIVILTIISFERYYAICHPLKAKFRCSMKRCHVLIAISWIVALIIALPTVISAEYPEDRNAGAICAISYAYPHLLQLHYIYFLTVLLVIPTVIMSYTYGRICYVLWKSSKKAAEMTNQDGKTKETSSPEIQARIKVIKTMVGLLLVFLVCWGPRLIINNVRVFSLSLRPLTEYYMDILSEILANGHSVVNPVMFIVFSQPFRQAFAKKFPRLCCLTELKKSASSKLSLVSGNTMSSTDGNISTTK